MTRCLSDRPVPHRILAEVYADESQSHILETRKRLIEGMKVFQLETVRSLAEAFEGHELWTFEEIRAVLVGVGEYILPYRNAIYPNRIELKEKPRSNSKCNKRQGVIPGPKC